MDMEVLVGINRYSWESYGCQTAGGRGEEQGAGKKSVRGSVTSKDQYSVKYRSHVNVFDET